MLSDQEIGGFGGSGRFLGPPAHKRPFFSGNFAII